jgi:hypothetical protein
LGTINATVAQRVPSALDAADALCSLIKPYDKDPQPLQVCRAFHLRDGKQVDLDDPAAESWLDATVGADVQLEAGSVRPASDDVRLYMLSGAQIEKGTYGLSYGACVKAQREQKGVDSIDLKDLDALTAICVATDEARNAILQVADYVPEDKSAVLAATCWRKPSA